MGRHTRSVSNNGTIVAPSKLITGNDKSQGNTKNRTVYSAGDVAEISTSPSAFSLFTRFQQKNSDFSGEWLMTEETEVSLVSPINNELMLKLRQRQDVIQKQRGGTAAIPPGEKEDTAIGQTAMTMSDGVEDEEYTPEGTESKKNNQHGKKGPCSSGDMGGNEEGIQGDYLSLLPTESAIDDVAKGDLQATLTVQESRNGMGVLETSSTQQLNSASVPSFALQQRVVPLWSVERFTAQNGYSTNPLIALHQEICDFVDYMRPSLAEISMRSLIAMEVRSIAKRLWPECDPVVFGSMSTGLLLPLSDLDMSILNVPVPTEDALIALAREIGREGLCHAAYPQLILKTKVPLVKFQHRLSMLDVDVSVNTSDGRRNSAIVVDMLRSFPEARPLTVLVKYFLQQRDMHEPYYGGLGSFATTLLVISFLQNHPIYTSHPEERKYSGLGRLLVDFFRYYGMYFNYDRCGISLLNGGRYFPRTDTLVTTPTSTPGQRFPARLPQMMVEDPGCPENNAASSLRSFHVITFLFTHAYMALTAVFDTPGGGIDILSPDSMEIVRRPTLLSRILHVDAPSVKRRQLIAAAYDTLMQDSTQRDKMLDAVAHFDKEAVLFEEASLQNMSSLNFRQNLQTRKRGRGNSSSTNSSNSGSRSSSNTTSSNDSSVLGSSRRFNK